MYNVYRKKGTREMILKSIATNINGQLVLSVKIIFSSFINAESLKFLSPTCGHRKAIQSNQRQSVYFVRLSPHAHVPNETDMKSTPFSPRSNKHEKFLFT